MKTIEIKCTGAATLKLEEIQPFQGALKDLSKENYGKLRKQILELGFSEPMSVWKSPEGKYMAINCHQRIRVLTELRRAEGYFIPPLPVSFIEASTEHEAKKKILALTSQFGEITPQGLFEFASINNIDLPTLEDLRFPEINMDSFKAEFFDMPLDFEEPDSKKDPEEKDFETKTCPSCGVLLEND